MADAEPAVPGAADCVRVFPGELGQVRPARRFVARVLVACPARETLLTCVTELAANAVEHTASGAGGRFTVAVGRPRDGVAFVAVTDQGGGGVPAAKEAEELAESGRGLALVAACSSRWGYWDTPWGRTVWAEATWPVAVRQCLSRQAWSGSVSWPEEARSGASSSPREAARSSREAGFPPSPPRRGGFPPTSLCRRDGPSPFPPLPDEPGNIWSIYHTSVSIPPGVA